MTIEDLLLNSRLHAGVKRSKALPAEDLEPLSDVDDASASESERGEHPAGQQFESDSVATALDRGTVRALAALGHIPMTCAANVTVTGLVLMPEMMDGA